MQCHVSFSFSRGSAVISFARSTARPRRSVAGAEGVFGAAGATDVAGDKAVGAVVG